MSNNNYHPKAIPVENSVFSPMGRGNWLSCINNALDGASWAKYTWELVTKEKLSVYYPELSKEIKGKGYKTRTGDPVLFTNIVSCGSSTDLCQIKQSSYDLVITDPPFGGLLHYAELADFFYVWLRLALKDSYPEYFSTEYTPKTMEAVANRARNPEDPDGFYKRLLTECWREAHRILKPGGIMSFTFHHSEDEPWVDVLESLFDAGFYLEATYPIRSDETKGQGEFGSKTIEYDIIHVCRKRIEEPKKISWPRLRRQIMQDVRQLQEMLQQHQNEGLPKADIQVIKRGKALEYFSKHYGQVYVEEGREFTVLEALVGINQLLDDQAETDEVGSIPANVEPMTRQFLRIFAGQPSVPRDQMQKYLRGTGMGPSDFVSRGWCFEKKKEFHWVSALEIAQEWKTKPKAYKTDLDQALLLVGACIKDSGVNTNKILNEEFKPHPALGDLTGWLIRFGSTPEVRQAATVARSLYNKWKDEHKSVVRKQFTMFDLEEAEV